MNKPHPTLPAFGFPRVAQTLHYTGYGRRGGSYGNDKKMCWCLNVSLAVQNLLILFLIWNIFFVIAEFESHRAICERGCLLQMAPGLTSFHDLPDLVGIPFGIEVLNGEYKD